MAWKIKSNDSANPGTPLSFQEGVVPSSFVPSESMVFVTSLGVLWMYSGTWELIDILLIGDIV